MPLKETNFVIQEDSWQEYDKMRQHLNGSDLVLLLLSIAPIKGKTKMQKQVFLAWKEIFHDVTLDPGFFPWKYGAFSKLVEDAVKILKEQGYIDIRRRKGEGSVYLIRPAGRKKIESKISKLRLDMRNLKERKTDWDEWTPYGILRYVYRKYPQYTSKSEVPSLKWE